MTWQINQVLVLFTITNKPSKGDFQRRFIFNGKLNQNSHRILIVLKPVISRLKWEFLPFIWFLKCVKRSLKLFFKYNTKLYLFQDKKGLSKLLVLKLHVELPIFTFIRTVFSNKIVWDFDFLLIISEGNQFHYNNFKWTA